MKTNCFIERNNLNALREMPNDSIGIVCTEPPFNRELDFVSGD